MDTRNCRKHGEQQLSAYYQFLDKDKRRYKCKLCVKDYDNRRKGRHSLQKKEKHKSQRYNILRHYSESNTPSCTCCKVTTIQFLTLDHKNNDGAAHRKEIGSGGEQLQRWIIKNNFPPMFRVLCFNCNNAYAIYGRCPHQEVANPSLP